MSATAMGACASAGGSGGSGGGSSSSGGAATVVGSRCHVQITSSRGKVISAACCGSSRPISSAEAHPPRAVSRGAGAIGGTGAAAASAVTAAAATVPPEAAIGFAYGGVQPGRLHAHGKLIDTHKVFFSIGRVGRYLLHIGLREKGLPLPGSPFRLEVVPGPAACVGTALPPEIELPLQGVVGLEDEYGCHLRLHVCDRVGNPCREGGARVTCAAVGSAHENKEAASSVKTAIVDNGDGTYSLTWRAEQSGLYARRRPLSPTPTTAAFSPAFSPSFSCRG